jgi:ribose transport system ATP-binding protein
VIYQELAQAEHLTVAENIFMGRMARNRLGIIDWRRARAESAVVLKKLGFNIDPTARIDTISVAQRQMVEIAKAIARNARVVVLDEPSAVLGDAELELLFNNIRRLSRDEGVSFIYISHRLKEIFEICDQVTVMRDGQLISTRPVTEVSTGTLIKQMVGRELNDIYPTRIAPENVVRLSVRNLHREGVLHDITFDVRKGEILGICGLAGSGRTEVLRAVAGADPIDGGEIRIDGKAVRIDGPAKALAHGVGLMPEDRKTEGLFLEQSVAFNVTISALSTIQVGGVLSAAKENNLVGRYIRQMNIKTPSAETRVRNLSGGNQQKCGLARQLNCGADILLIDEPTRGVDVAAKREIYDLLVELTARRGASVVMVSSELPEVIGLCTRIVVMREGRVSQILDGPGSTEESIMQHAVWH